MASPRRKVPVAVCLAGLSPAVVTETLYALATRRHKRVIPREIHLITTHGGYPTVVASLLGPAGALARLRQQYRLPASSLLCTDAHLHVLRDWRGRPLEDIRTPEDSRATGEFIGALLRWAPPRAPARRTGRRTDRTVCGLVPRARRSGEAAPSGPGDRFMHERKLGEGEGEEGRWLAENA